MKEKIHWKKNNTSRIQIFSNMNPKNWPVIIGNSSVIG